MTRRLTIVIVSVVLATLLVAGVGTIVVGNLRARQTTEVELRRQAESVAANLDQVVENDAANATPAAARRRLRVFNAFRAVLKLDGLSILTLQPNGNFIGDVLPAGLSASELSATALRQLKVVSGVNGNLVFAAAPVKLPTGNLVVVLLSRKANSGLAASLRTFLLAALATLALGAGAAILLGRRLTRPIREASEATNNIARGQLSTRLPEPARHHTDELAQLARSVNAMAAELERARVLEQQFLLSVSHDLRTPLTSIRGYAEAISDGAGDPQHAATVIQSEARRLERLVADLLDLAKVRAQGFSLRVERVDIVALAAVSIEGFAPDAGERKLTISHVGGGQLIVSADHDRLAQVVANLLENALKYASSAVTVTTAQDGTWAVLAVDDDGPGISPTDLPHVFDRLYVARRAPARKENSSGLGLAIVKELMEAMGGGVMVAQAPAGGARFVVRLPLLPVTPAASVLRSETESSRDLAEE
jgi:signal transduction histidine kinase